MPPSEIRWTRGRFEMEVPVWPDRRYSEIVLVGILPKVVRDRQIKVEIFDGATGRRTQAARARFDKTDYGNYVLPLTGPLARGIHRLRFTMGTWSPKALGQGSDPRELGFYLKALGLRATPLDHEIAK
jgi:hypothetical protein